MGADAVRAADGRGRLRVLVIARDASPNAAGRAGDAGRSAPIVRVGTRETLGRAIGRPVAALVGITDRDLGDRIAAVTAGPRSGGPETSARKNSGGST